jgi:hypothetical protein
MLLLVLYGASYRHIAGSSSLLQESSASKNSISKYITGARTTDADGPF